MQKYSPFFSAVLLLIAQPVMAKEPADWQAWPLGDRFIISAGAFFPNIDTKVSAADAANPVSAVIDFERDLGLDDSAIRPLAAFGWHFAKNHKLTLNYFNLDRSGDSISNATITLGDLVIEAGVPVQAFLDVEVFEVSYAYSLVFRENIDWSVGLGLSLQRVDMGVLADDGLILTSQDISVNLPLPTLNTAFSYAFTDKWIGRASLGWLAVEADVSDSTDFNGSIWTGSVALRYKAFKNIGVDLAWTYFDVDVDYFKRDLIGTLDYRYLGPVVGIEWFF